MTTFDILTEEGLMRPLNKLALAKKFLDDFTCCGEVFKIDVSGFHFNQDASIILKDAMDQPNSTEAKSSEERIVSSYCNDHSIEFEKVNLSYADQACFYSHGSSELIPSTNILVINNANVTRGQFYIYNEPLNLKTILIKWTNSEGVAWFTRDEFLAQAKKEIEDNRRDAFSS
jgi:hypothetical protein